MYTLTTSPVYQEDRNCSCGGKIRTHFEDGDHSYWAMSCHVCDSCSRVYQTLPTKLLEGTIAVLVEDKKGNYVGSFSCSPDEMDAKAELVILDYENDEYAGDY